MKPRSAAAIEKNQSGGTKPRISIRVAEKTDAAALAVLMGELGYPTRTSEMEQRLHAMSKEQNYRALVAIIDEELCGMIGLCWLHSYEHNSPGGRILALVVSEKMRGKGVGRALIEAAEADFAARNVRRVALNTRFEREDAHRFYEALGYVKNGYRLVKELER